MRIRLPLWTHQLVEYLLAVLIVTQSVNAGKAATFMAVTGGLLFVVAATTDASMGRCTGSRRSCTARSTYS